MKSYRGTLVPLIKDTTSYFVCERCGIRKQWSGTRKRPKRCRDCSQIDPWPTFVRRAS